MKRVMFKAGTDLLKIRESVTPPGISHISILAAKKFLSEALFESQATTNLDPCLELRLASFSASCTWANKYNLTPWRVYSSTKHPLQNDHQLSHQNDYHSYTMQFSQYRSWIRCGKLRFIYKSTLADHVICQ
jgi:hypothetical protein